MTPNPPRRRIRCLTCGLSQVSTNSFQAPRDPSQIIFNAWSDGGSWSGNMSVNSEAYLQIQWIDVVYNNTDATIGVMPSANAKCATVCSIDETKTVGVPVLITSTPSTPNGGKCDLQKTDTHLSQALTAPQDNRAPRRARPEAARLVRPQNMGSARARTGMDAPVVRAALLAGTRTTIIRNVSRPRVSRGAITGYRRAWFFLLLSVSVSVAVAVAVVVSVPAYVTPSSENFLGYQCACGYLYLLAIRPSVSKSSVSVPTMRTLPRQRSDIYSMVAIQRHWEDQAACQVRNNWLGRQGGGNPEPVCR